MSRVHIHPDNVGNGRSRALGSTGKRSSQIPTAPVNDPSGDRDRFFDPWLSVGSERLQSVADRLVTELEANSGPRQRRPKRRDLETKAKCVSTILANLAYAIVAEWQPLILVFPLAKSRTKLSRYERQGLSSMRDCLSDLDRLGFLRLNVAGRKRGRASTIEPSQTLVRIVRDASLGFDDFARAPGEETIILSRTERDYAGHETHREWIDYDDDNETHRYRKEVATINAALASADLAFIANDGSLVDTRGRTLRRFFKLLPDTARDRIGVRHRLSRTGAANAPAVSEFVSADSLGGSAGHPRFALGGRLFGGWWQSLEKHRREHIRIDGEPVTDIDFRSMFLRLAYWHAGLPQPPADDDLYALPGLEQHREAVKKVVSAMLFRSGALTRLPKGTAAQLPDDLTGKALRSAIIAKHPNLAGTFETGIGLSLMFAESQILVAALLKLIDAGTIGLAMHDGLMVPRSKADAAAVLMADAAEELTGCQLPVDLKGLHGSSLRSSLYL